MAGGETGVYALSWLMTYLLEDPCYCDFLLQNPMNASAYETNIECESLQLNENHAGEILTIYPNPSNQSISIEIVDLELVEFKIYNSDGKCVKAGLVSKQYNKIEIEALMNGIYTLRVDNINYRLVKI